MSLQERLGSLGQRLSAIPLRKRVLSLGAFVVLVVVVAIAFVTTAPPEPRRDVAAVPVPENVTDFAPSEAPTASANAETTVATETLLASTGAVANASADETPTHPAPNAKRPSGTQAPGPDQPPVKVDEKTVGLSAAQRKAIALELIAMEKKATTEAEAKYPTDPAKGGSAANYPQYEEYWGQLDERHKADIMKKHSITLDQLLFVVVIDVPQYQ